MVNEIRMRRVNWIKPSKTKMYEKWSQIQCAKNRCGPVFTFVVLALAGLAPFECYRQSDRRKNLTQG